RFAGWGGACSGTGSCRFVPRANDVVTAAFVYEGLRPLFLALEGGQGSVTVSPGGDRCEDPSGAGQSCTFWYTRAGGLTLRAAAAPGFRFGGWGGSCPAPGACRLVLSNTPTVPAISAPAP